MGECRRRRWVAHAIATLIGGWLLSGARPAQAGILQATYLGGSGHADARALAVDPASGDILVAGSDSVADLLGTSGSAQPDSAGAQDGWVVRLGGDLRTVKQATYLGGSAADQAEAIAIDPASGDILVAGVTQSEDFPGTVGGAQAQLGGGADVFVARLSADLQILRQATYLGGSADEGATLVGVAIDRTSGDIVVAGTTSSSDFPGTAKGAQSKYGGNTTDGFVARLKGNLKTLVQATYVSDSGAHAVYNVAINPLSNEVVVGGASTPSNSARRFGVVTCFSSDLKALKGIAQVAVAGTNTSVWGLAMDPLSGDVVAAGETSGGLENAGAGARPNFGGGSSDAFVARFTRDLFPLQATYLGGSQNDGTFVKPAIRPDTGEVIVAGSTQSSDFPGTAGGAQPAPNGGVDSFVARLRSDLTVLEQATYVGGSLDDTVYQVVVADGGGEVVVAGATLSTDFPATAGGAQPMFASPQTVGDPVAAFAARISGALRADSPTPTAVPSTPTMVSPTPTATGASTASATAAPTRLTICIGDCSGTRQVTIGNLITGVDIALGDLSLSTCAALDANGDGRISINELIEAVGNALNGCA